MGRPRRQRQRRAASVLTAVAVAALAVAWTGPWSGAATEEVLNSTHPLETFVNVSPSDLLDDEASVSVSGRGFHPDGTVDLLQCSPAPFLSRDSAVCQRRGSAPTDGSGAFVGADAVVRVEMEGSIECRLPLTCGLYAVSTGPDGNERLAGHHLAFRPVPDPPDPTVPPPPPTTSPTTTTTTTPTTSPPTSPPTVPPSVPVAGPPGSPDGPPPSAPSVLSGDTSRSAAQGSASSAPRPAAEVPGELAAPPAAESASAALASGSPTARARPTQVKAGQEVLVSGGGFAAGETLEIAFDSTAARLDTTSSDDSGNYQRVVRIPGNARPGDHEIIVSSASGLRAGTRIKVVTGEEAGSSKSALLSSPVLLAVIAALLFGIIRLWRLYRRQRLVLPPE